MDCVVFLPGTMGSVLSTPDGEVVWPPTVAEAQFGYTRKAKLLRPDLVVSDIVRSVACFGVYQPLVDQLNDAGFPEAGPGNSGGGNRLNILAYDWRLDLERLSNQLANSLDAIAKTGVQSITIVAHSMGGLIARLALESGKHDGEAWFPKVKSFISVGTPHLGAPLALARILGMDSSLGISGPDFREIASDRRYPSGYQLLPPPGEGICWDIASLTLQPMNIYDPAVAAKLGLDPVLLVRAKFVHDTLRAGKAPAHTRYFYFAGTGHKTATRINVGSTGRQITLSDDAGDGTVPLWSALPVTGQKQLVVGEHAKFFTQSTFKAVFFRLLGKTFSQPPIGLAGTALDLSVQSPIIPKSHEVELLLISAAPVPEIKGEVTIERTEDPAKPWVTFRAPAPVVYTGPPLSHLRLLLPATGKTGLFRLSFGGADPVMFAASET